MASEIQMPEPVCLIENKKGKGLVVQPEALQLLSEITQPMVVVAIAGPYRSGKSYLLNWLAGQRRGFSLGSSVRAHTKGIWMWCMPHPCKPGHTLVLLDTEGLGDTEKGDTKNDTWIFVLAVLLSSTLIYNSKGTIDQQAMDNLHYVLKLSECVQVKTAPEEAGEEQAGAEQAGAEQAGEQEAGHDQAGEEQAREEEAGLEQAGLEQAGEEQAGEEQVGEEQAGEEQAGEEQAGLEQAGLEQAGDEQAGEEQAGEEQVGEEQAGDEQAGEEQAGEEQAGEKEAGHDQAGEEQVGEEQVGEEEAGEEQAGDEQAGDEQAGEERAGEKEAGHDQAGEEEAGIEQAGDEQAGEEQAGEEQAGDEQAGEEQAGEEQAGHEQPGSDRRALFFSTFIWAVRDFTLQLEVDGKEISEDEYLENALKLKDGSSQEAQSYNRLRECIRQLFPERKCFVFDQPARKKDLPHLEELPDDMLDPEFQQQVERFCSYIWQNCPPKTIPGGRKITGSRLGTLAENYVEAIRSGAVPCLESAVLALAQIENSAALKEAVALYKRQMEQGLPTETTQELLELHARCEEEAMRLFMARAFEERREQFRAELTVQLKALKEHFRIRNERVSYKKCTAILHKLFQDLERQFIDGVYLKLWGYKDFQRDQKALVEQYKKRPGKGVKADAALWDFLQEREFMYRSLKDYHEKKVSLILNFISLVGFLAFKIKR